MGGTTQPATQLVCETPCGSRDAVEAAPPGLV